MAFAPSDLDDLQLWLKADALTGLADGDAVSTWADSSGQGHDATQSGSARPLYKTGVINGHPVIRFDGVNDCLLHDYLGAMAAVFIVASGVSNVAFHSMMGAKSNSSGTGGADAYYLQLTGGASFGINRWNRITTDGTTFSVDAANPVDGVFLQTGTIDGNVLGMWLNGTAAGTMTNAGARATIDGPASIGAAYFNDALTDFWDGDIAEVVVSGTALTTAQRRAVVKYLAAKYDITIPNTAPTAPTLTAPTASTVAAATLAVAWEAATDADGDGLTYTGEISLDNGVTWQTAFSATTALAATVDVSALAATVAAKVRVKANDGTVDGAWATSAAFTISHTVSGWTACAAPPATTWTACDPRPTTTWTRADPPPATTWKPCT